MTASASNTASSESLDYIGDELELFKHATNWKSYFASKLKPSIGGDVAEVGAGLGGTTATLCSGDEPTWLCLEPDSNLADQISKKVDDGQLPGNVSVRAATLAATEPGPRFDTILYVDVLEHIEADAAEVALAVDRLKPGGKLVVLSPAHQALFSPFDARIGHFRRYSKSSLSALTPPTATLDRLFYLDSIGLLASAANKVLLNQAEPKLSQIQVWDKAMVPVSRVVDPLIFGSLGKTVVAVWTKPN
ncbi:MAG: class I SAM-dependent methyltransferase [Pseudomonadota bacterium]